MQENINSKVPNDTQSNAENQSIISYKNENILSSQYKLTLKNPSQNIKNLLLDRFKQKKDKLIQSSSIYFNTGEVKIKKSSASQRPSLLSLIKQTSLQKLPHLQKTKQKLRQNLLSQTIDHNQSLNESKFSTLNSFQRSYNTIDIQSYESSNLHNKNDSSFKRSSLEKIQMSPNKFNSAQKFPKKIEKNQKNSDNASFQLQNQLKKKYLKSIVDRYFPVDQNQDQRQQKNNPSKRILNIQRQKLKLTNPKISLPSINRSIDGKKSSQNVKDMKNFLKNEEIPNRQNVLQKQKLNQINQIHHSLFKSNPSSISLAQSYILQQISQDEEFQQNQDLMNDFYQNAAFYDRTGLFSTKSQTSLILNGSMQDLNQSRNVSRIQKVDENKTKQIRQKVYQNSSFVIFKVKTCNYQNLSQLNDIKFVSFQTQFRKHFKSEAALELKNRQFKAKNMIQARNKYSSIFLWQQDMFDSDCIKINLNKISTFLSQTPLSLGKLLCKIQPYQSGSSKFALVQPVTSSRYQFSTFTQNSLLSNFQFGLLKFIKNISQQFQPLSFSLINNKLSLNNIFMIQDDRYAINQWGYSFFKQQYLIQTKKFQKRLQPILKNEAGEWFVTPQYLAPQILENLCYSRQQVIKYWKKIQGKKMQKAIVSQNDLFEYGNKADVWSLGLIILEIITLIPMWIGQKCIVQNKTSPKISPRKGLLHSQDRNLLKILTKQSYLRQNLAKILRIQSQPYVIEDWLKSLINKMIDLDPKTRISFKGVLIILNQEQMRIKQNTKIGRK